VPDHGGGEMDEACEVDRSAIEAGGGLVNGVASRRQLPLSHPQNTDPATAPTTPNNARRVVRGKALDPSMQTEATKTAH